MDLAIKFADSSILLSTTFDDESKGVSGELYGINFRLDNRPNNFRSGFLADGMTAWDHMYRYIASTRAALNARIPMFIPTTEGLKEFHLNPGEHVVLGATASGKSTTLFKGIKPFLDKVPTSANQVIVFAEDYINGCLEVSQPVELFVELASHILSQMASFFTVAGVPVDVNDDDHLKVLNKEYTKKEFNKKFAPNVTPLPRIIYLESIRDFVYTSGVSGKGGFNMRIAIESSHLKKALEKLNIHLFVTVNPLLAIEDKKEMLKLASDFDSSVTSVILQTPTKERDTNPTVKVFARGPANADRDVVDVIIRNLFDQPVTSEEILSKVSTSIILEVDSSNDPVVETEEWVDSAYVSNSSMNNTKAMRLFSENLRRESSVTTTDDFLDLLNNMNNEQ